MSDVVQSPRLIRFESFYVDLKSGELYREGVKVKLPEQSFQILAMLLERPGDVLTRQAIQKKLWPNDTVVEFENSINAAVKRLRVALQDSADQPRYIETLARRGYRWVGPVEKGGPAAQIPIVVVPHRETAASSSLIGKKVSHYRALEILGGGGMGIVYKAEDLKLGRRVALKFLPEELANDAIAMERFQREARAASAINHPNICTIYEVEEHAGQPFIVMEFLEGLTLRESIDTAQASPATEQRHHPHGVDFDHLCEIAVQIAQGLEAAHNAGIIHRDVKPANIFVTTRGQVKILDFGLAQLQESELEERASAGEKCAADLQLTRTGATVGTAGYMSPEQVRGEKLDRRTDLFNFGLVLYEMAAGQRAFTGEAVSLLHDAILNHTPTPVRQFDASIPGGLEKIISKALEKTRDSRYQSATDMLADLKQLKELREPAVPAVALTHSGNRILSWRNHVLALTLACILALAGFHLYHRGRQAQRITERNTVVLADFANTTGDTVFDGTLRQALAIQLEQSPFLKVLPDQRVSATLRLMNRLPSERLMQGVAREVCLRTNSTVLLIGSIANAGSRYAVSLKALDCDTANTLANAEAEANRKEDVLKALGKASNIIRKRLGESLASVEKFGRPLDQVTTSSLEALKSYTEGQRVFRDTGSAEAIPYYKHAVVLDPNFVRAYVALEMAYGNLYQGELANESGKKACELRDRVAGRERFSVEADSCAGPDLMRSIEVYTRWTQTYPTDAVPHLNLGNRFAELGQLERSAAEMREYLRLAPDSVLGYGNLIEGYLPLNRVDEANAAFEEAQAHKLDGFYLRVARYYLAFVQEDSAAMQEQVTWAMGKPGAEDALLSAESDTRAYRGRLTEARSLTDRAVESAKRAGANDTAAGWKVNAALREAELGNRVEARKAVMEALALAPGEYRELQPLALARAGDANAAEYMADKLSQDLPSDTLLQLYWLPTIRASIELDRGHAQHAIELLDKASAYDLGDAGPGQVGAMYPVYVRGLAYLKAGHGGQAAQQFQNILNHYGLVLNFPLGALARLQLARARKLSGDTAGARTAYQDFLALWKDADPDIPILKQAKAEYAKLQ